MRIPLRPIVRFSGVLPLAVLASCNMVVLSPSGDVATQQRDLILISTVLMLLIIVPVITMTLFFAWRYRSSNLEARYDPDWHHSTALEVIIWSAPLAIVIALGAVTWISTHKLDPYRALYRLDATRPVPSDIKPLTVEVVALDWKWLFFYPDYGIATVNELAAPVDVPIEFKITSSSVMNAFYVPALAGMIYAMPGMQTRLHAVINREGEYQGLSSNYSGDGFSHMRFKFHGLTQAGFNDWIARVKAQGSALNRDTYLKLEKPSIQDPVRYYASVDNGLYDAVLNLCARPGKMCMGEMMDIDMKGGGGTESDRNRERLDYDNRHIQESDGAPAATFPATGHQARSEKPAEGVDDKNGTGDSGKTGGDQGGDAGHGSMNHDMNDGQTKPGDASKNGAAKDGAAPAQLNTGDAAQP